MEVYIAETYIIRPNIPLLPLLSTRAETLDLTQSRYRAASPVHVRYLQNMGVCGSMSISLIVNNKLWGLIACHSYDDFKPAPVWVPCAVLGLGLPLLSPRGGFCACFLSPPTITTRTVENERAFALTSFWSAFLSTHEEGLVPLSQSLTRL